MRIGIVTDETSVYPPAGGIATASEGLLKGLQQRGWDVELLYFPDFSLEDRNEAAERELRMRVFSMDRAHQFKRQKVSSRSYAAFQYLSNHSYDLLLWPDYRGLGFYSMQATRCGTAMVNTRHLVLSYGPLAWCRQGSGDLEFSPARAEVEFLERSCYRDADGVIFNSKFLQQWCREQEYEIKQSVVIPSLVPAHFTTAGRLRDQSDYQSLGDTRPIEELAFFGRLESRKGFELFVQAIQRLAKRRDLTGLRVSFFGRPIFNRGLWAHIDIIDQLIDLPIALHLVDDASTRDFVNYCASHPVLAITPSIDDNLPGTMIECVNHGIPLLGSNRGGAPEIVAEVDHPWLCDPEVDALTERIERALNQGHPTLRPAHFPEHILDRWCEHLQSFVGQSQSARGVARQPKLAEDMQLNSVATESALAANLAESTSSSAATLLDATIGIVHYNRPHLLSRALRGVLEQTRLPKCVLVIDDNSPCRSELESVLNDYRSLLEARGVRFQTHFNSSNLYLGACRNRLLANVETPWVLFLDDDDVAMPEMLERLLAIAVDQQAQVAVPHLFYLPEQASEATDYEQVIASRKAPSWFFRGADVTWGLFGNAFGPACCLMSTSAIRDVGGYTELVGVGYEDYELLFKLALRGQRFAVHVEALLAYRTNPNSMAQTTKTRENFARVFRMLREEASKATLPLRVDMLCEFVFTKTHDDGVDSQREPVHEFLKHRTLATKSEVMIARRLKALMAKTPSKVRFGKASLEGAPAASVSERRWGGLILDWWARRSSERPQP